MVALHARRQVDPQRPVRGVVERVAGEQVALDHQPVERAVERAVPGRARRRRRARAGSCADRSPARLGGEERRRDVALAGVRAARRRSAAARPSRAASSMRRPQRRADGDAGEHALACGRRARAVSSASSSSTGMISSTRERSSTGGTNPAPMPWILCGPGLPAGQHRRRGRLDGDDAAARVALLQVAARRRSACRRCRRRRRGSRPPAPSPPRSRGRWRGSAPPGWRGWRTGRAASSRRRARAPGPPRPPRSCRRATR